MWGQNAVYILHTAEIHLITIRAASSDKNNTKSTDCCIQIRSFTCLSFVKFGINPLLHVQLPFFVLGAAYQCQYMIGYSLNCVGKKQGKQIAVYELARESPLEKDKREAKLVDELCGEFICTYGDIAQ